MKYEIKRFGSDPFDIMCSDCEVHKIWWWEDATLEDLHSTHTEELEMDASTPDWMIEEMQEQGEWHPASHDFDEWLRQNIKASYIRATA